MKKILSVVLVLAMVLALGVTAFAESDVLAGSIKAGETVGLTIAVNGDTSKGVTVTDPNGVLVFTEPVVGADFVAFNVTAPAGSEGKIAQIVIKAKDEKKTNLLDAPIVVFVEEAEEPAAPEADATMDKAAVEAATSVDATNKATVTMAAGVDGIAAAAYNYLKGQNYETITFVDAEGAYVWTLTRGDYTKMNVTASIYFGVEVSDKLYKQDENKNWVEDTAKENAVLKALGNTKADVFYVTINDNVNIGNVASKPALTIDVNNTWVNYNNKFSVTAYKFDGETVAKAAEGLAVKPATGKMTLNLTTAGLYVFVADNYTVNPTAPSTSEKPNASTGANNAAAAVVAMAVMAVAAVASKKIVK